MESLDFKTDRSLAQFLHHFNDRKISLSINKCNLLQSNKFPLDTMQFIRDPRSGRYLQQNKTIWSIELLRDGISKIPFVNPT